ncbi:MAG: DEAD/DEAH box helicase [Phycisphaeraceae bacterium]|nr:DEAD/DEAH box helicase [Phycisphaeraceae bacterium]
MPFATLGLTSNLLKALVEEGYTTPTPIQAQAIGPILTGRDLLGCAQTGTGKTAAFALPILHRLTHQLSLAQPDHHHDRPNPQPVAHAQPQRAHNGRHVPNTRHAQRPGPRVLVLSPTRELASQIGESFATYGRHTGLSHAVIFGGVSQHHQVKALQRGVDILIATPGRLIDLMEQGHADLSNVRIFVLDEADRMLDMGFIQPIRRIAAALVRPPVRQTLLFSATMPREIMHLADSLLHDPVKVAVTPVASAAPKISQSLYFIPRQRKLALLATLLADPAVERALVFTKTKHGADRLSRQLHANNITNAAIHGNKAQNQRTRALDAFRAGRARVLVATDVAARGIDVDGVTHVFNYDLPMEPEAYVHRIGRTGRAGASGIAVSFCGDDEVGLLRQIERLTRAKLPVVQPPAKLLQPVVELKPTAADDSPRDQRRSAGQYRGQSSHHRSGGKHQGGHSGHGGYGPRSDQRRTQRPSHPHAHAPHASGHAAHTPRADESPDAPRPSGAASSTHRARSAVTMNRWSRRR